MEEMPIFMLRDKDASMAHQLVTVLYIIAFSQHTWGTVSATAHTRAWWLPPPMLLRRSTHPKPEVRFTPARMTLTITRSIP
jgi:hypothetical protein